MFIFKKIKIISKKVKIFLNGIVFHDISLILVIIYTILLIVQGALSEDTNKKINLAYGIIFLFEMKLKIFGFGLKG